MELRELKYFLAIANYKSISKAAKALYLTQPSLSRQMQNLEKEIGQQLFIRSNKNIKLTNAGILLQKRAEEILLLTTKTKDELSNDSQLIYGDIHIGGGESHAIDSVAKVASKINKENENIKFHFYSADTETVMEKLDNGVIDFGILVEPADLTKYEYIRLPKKDIWGALMRKDHRLANNKTVTMQDIKNEPIIISRHAQNKTFINNWFDGQENIKIVGTYNLLYNASILVNENYGIAIGLDKLINTQGTDLVFVPLKPQIETTLVVAWKKNQVFSKCANKFLTELKKEIKI